MIKNTSCKRLTDCAQCSKVSEGIFVFRKISRGYHSPVDKCTQNCMLFMIKGELLINSQEYPGTTLHEGQFVLQAIGSKLELLALTNVEYIAYWFNELPQICENRYKEILAIAEAPLTYSPLVMSQRLSTFMLDIGDY